MTEWKTFKVKKEDFSSLSAYQDYLENTRCGICHKKLEIGEEFDLRPIQTLEETRKYHDSDYTSIAIIVHRKCVEA